MTTQKNKRLSQADKDNLYRLARKSVAETQDTAELDAAYNAAADCVHAVLVEKYPQKDMRVLEKYGAATADECVYISKGYYDYDQFFFRAGDKRIPLRPRGRGCNSRNAFMLEGEAADVYSAFQAASEGHAKAVNQRLSDYKALIDSARSFNEVAEVWPHAEALRTTIVGSSTALSVLSNDVIERLKADPARELEIAA